MIGFLVVDGAGTILRIGRSREPASQLGLDGAAVYVLEGWDGSMISDQHVKVVGGEFVAVDPYSGPLPAATLTPLEA